MNKSSVSKTAHLPFRTVKISPSYPLLEIGPNVVISYTNASLNFLLFE